MIRLRMLRGLLLWSALLVSATFVPAQQGGQQGGGSGSTGGGTGGGTAGGSQGSGGTAGSTNTTTRPAPSTSRSQSGVNPNQGRQQQPMPFISGVVVMEDGSQPPFGIVIERICGGNKTKESHVSSTGHFSFQVGSNTSLMMDASDSGWDGLGLPGGSGTRAPNNMPAFSMRSSSDLMGCELRASLPGYRSSVVNLAAAQIMGRVVDVGTIVLHPISKVQGTTVSAASLQAPKDARKAMERGEKALRNQKLDEAEKNLRAAVEIYPSYADAWFTLGRIHYQQQRTEDARLAFSKAREADGNYVLPYVELARLAALEKKWQEVADLTDHALALNPLDIPDGFFLNSVAYYNLKNLEAAERSARKAQRLDSLHKYTLGHLILASILQHKKDFTGEAEQLRLYLRYAPQGTNAGQAQTRLNELDRLNGAVADKQRPQP